MLLAFLVLVSLMSPLCDCAFTFQPGAGTPGFICSAPTDCQASPFTNTRQCCAGSPNGKYCSECCVDTDCPGAPGGFICTPLGFLFPSLAETHARFCIKSKIFQSSQPCYQNDQCKSNNCIGGSGLIGEKVKLPLGKCGA